MTTETLRLLEGVRVLPAADGVALLHTGRGVALGPLTAGQRAVLRLLTRDGGTRERLTEEATAADGPAGVVHAHALLSALSRRRWLSRTLRADGRALVTFRPSDAVAVDPTPEAAGGPALVLSRFTVARRSGDTLVLESPRAHAVATLHGSRALLLLGRLAAPLTGEAAAAFGAWGPPVLEALRECGLAVPEGSAEETELFLRQWTPHELWFHMRSNVPMTGRPWGATSWARDRFDPPPARPAPAGTARVCLPVPDLGLVAAADPPLTLVLESRRSIREHEDEHPIDTEQLGEFLYRTVRVRGVRTHDGLEVVDRPHPSGGSLHELQVYVAAREVAGLERGLYRYDGVDHALDRVAPYEEHVPRLVEHASSAIRSGRQPQAVVVVTARFGRTMWKYESMAYALVLKNAGALQASMYLVATAMRLAACAIAGPDADAFARATGLDPAAEAGVGGFVLGTAKRRPSSREEGEQHP
jgi:SagB-type dehydrogenase family enzyme